MRVGGHVTAVANQRHGHSTDQCVALMTVILINCQELPSRPEKPIDAVDKMVREILCF